MEPFVPHRISLELNKAGYKGADIDEILPSFMTRRDTLIGVTWKPSAEGPESFTLGIVIGIALSLLAQGFIAELGKDMYQWAKTKLLPLFKRKGFPTGRIKIEIERLTLVGDVEKADTLAEFFEKLPALLAEVASKTSQNKWMVEYDETKNEWVIVKGNRTAITY